MNIFPRRITVFPKHCVLWACFFILVSCGGGGGSEGPAPISPPPSNSPPRFTSPTEFSFAENQAVSFVVSVSDADGDTVTISEAGSGDGGLFQLNASTGEVTALTDNGAFNFEDPLDQDRNNVYEQSFVLNDGRTSVTQTVTVTITNVIEAPSYQGATDFVAGEGVIGFAISATDNDSSELGFTLGGPDAGAFNIVNGDLVFVEAPDFENPADADTNNVYELVLSISNSEATSVVNLTATINNVDEPPVCESAETFSFSENVAGEIYRFVAIDPEGDAVSFENFVITAENEIFDKLSLDPISGALSLSQAVDFEALTNPSGQLSVSAGETICSVSFTVTDQIGRVTSGLKLLGDASLVVSAGDVDGDGVEDLWLSADAENGGQGHLVFGSYMNSEMPAATLDIANASSTQILPISLSANNPITSSQAALLAHAVDDIDGDNLDELLIGFSRCEACPESRDMAYLVWGSTLQANTTSQLILDELSADQVLAIPFKHQAAEVVSFTAGDYDGDGKADLAFGLPFPSEAAYVVFGDYLAAIKQTGTVDYANAAQNQILDLNIDYSLEPFAGEQMATLADIDGDTHPELIVSSSAWIYVVYSSTITSGRSAENLQLGTSGFDLQINATSGVQSISQRPFDLEGDAIPEIAWTMPSGGLASIALGETFSNVPNTKFVDDTSTFRLSMSISSLSDINADGLSELILASRTAGENSIKEVVVLSGSAFDAVSEGFFVDLATVTAGESLIIRGFASSTDGNDLTVSGFSDLDGDGLEELVLSDPVKSEVYVLRGLDIANALTSGNTSLEISPLFNNENE